MASLTEYSIICARSAQRVTRLVQHHQTRLTLSFPTVPSAAPSESEKCRFNCSHLTAHSFGVESQARARSR
jgi:hypothetical protein